MNSGQNVCEGEDTVQWRVLLNPVQNLHTSPHFCVFHLFILFGPPHSFSSVSAKKCKYFCRTLELKNKEF